MKILLLDIETSPNKGYFWTPWNVNIAPSQMIDTSTILCFAAKWLGDDRIIFHSIHKDGHKRMLQKAHKLLSEADVVVHYNGTKFDIPVLNKEFLLLGMAPPAPFKQVDLYRIVRNKFKFAYNKLDFVAQALGLGNKVRHKGFELWVECAEGKEDAWKQMETYNVGDVVLTEKVYHRLLSWIHNHPSWGVYNGDLVCPNCGAKHYQKRGVVVAKTLKYQRYQCQECGHWFRGNKTISEKGEEKFVHIS